MRSDRVGSEHDGLPPPGSRDARRGGRVDLLHHHQAALRGAQRHRTQRHRKRDQTLSSTLRPLPTCLSQVVSGSRHDRAGAGRLCCALHRHSLCLFDSLPFRFSGSSLNFLSHPHGSRRDSSLRGAFFFSHASRAYCIFPACFGTDTPLLLLLPRWLVSDPPPFGRWLATWLVWATATARTF